MNDITALALRSGMQRKRHNWGKAVMRTCEFCDHYAMTVLVEGAATCANCCDAEYTSHLLSLLEQAAVALEAKQPHHNGMMQLSNELVMAKQRIAELESRTVTVKLPADRAAESEISGYDGTEFYRSGWNARGKAVRDVLTAAGIQVIEGDA